MKITRIKLKNYYQFKDLDIDLTYPRGHAKAGQPLDKVCFIGQGGTGKTTFLRLIKWFISLKRDIGKNLLLPVLPIPMSVQIEKSEKKSRISSIKGWDLALSWKFVWCTGRSGL